MEALLKNPELKSVLIKMAVVQGIFLIIIFVLINNETVSMNNKIVDQNTALAGKILSEYPKMEDKIAEYIKSGATEAEIAKGRQILGEYGYNTKAFLSSQITFKNTYMPLTIKVVLLVLFFFIPVCLLIMFEYSKIYKKVSRISIASDKVVEGDYNIVMPENSEGEFGKLGHSFNAMSNRLKLSIENLNEDKIFLKNIISDISHQLKTPLASLIMLNENLLQDKNMGEETRLEFLNRSKGQLDRMEWLVKNLLKMARLEADAVEFHFEKAELIMPVQRAVTNLKSLWEEKGQAIIIKGQEKVCFNGDEEWLEEAFVNIIKNCIEHTGSGGKIIIEMNETPLFSRVSIKDNGEGIDKNDLPHIFERFYKGNNSVKTESVGIGLSLARLIIEKQRGSITVSSVKGEGTEFVITFLKGVI